MNDMTDEKYNKATQLKRDIKAIQDCTINKDVSQELFNWWKKVMNEKLDELREEYSEL